MTTVACATTAPEAGVGQEAAVLLRRDVVVRLDQLSFGYDCAHGPVLDKLDFEVARGEFVAVLGPSGAGKSSLLRIIAGLLRPSAGTVAVAPGAHAGSRARALVFQDPRLLPWRDLLGNVQFGLEGLKLGRTVRRQRAALALEMVGMADFGNRWPHQLSGGQRQRVGLARALAVQPNLLLLDEPFAALDSVARQALQDLLLDLWRRSNASVVFVTHDVEEAAYLADRVVVLDGGRIARQIVVDA
ncbi:MAG TPA: ATP-binding cassette domain-containing protein, partial [Rhizomicrobium sp.]|nr:ATP-binding cassette domain-containing protein [Rhizomicrobium sp.]